jgi:hypothetical protein
LLGVSFPIIFSLPSAVQTCSCAAQPHLTCALAPRFLSPADTQPLEQFDFNSMLQTNIDAAATLDAFMKDTQEKEKQAVAATQV